MAGAAAAVVAVVAGMGVAPHLLRGQRLVWLVERFVPEIRGQIHVGGGGDWTWSTAWNLVRGQRAPVNLDDARVSDPEGTEVLRARHLACQIELHRDPLLVLVHDVALTGVTWRFGRMKGSEEIGFLAALKPRKPQASGTAPPTVTFDGVHIDGLDATIDFAEWGLVLRNARARGELSFAPDAAGQTQFGFQVHHADIRGGGTLRILAGARALELPFSNARLEHAGSVSSTAGGAPDSIAVRASNVVTGRSAMALDGTFFALYGQSPSAPTAPPNVELRAQITRPADALGAVLRGHAPDELQVTDTPPALLTAAFRGPLVAVAIQVVAQGVGTSYRGLEARDITLAGDAEPAAGKLRVTHLELASAGGGRLGLTGTLDLRRATAHVSCQRLRVADSPMLPGSLRPLTEGIADGTVTLGFNRAAQNILIDDVALDWTRPAGSAGPRTIHLRSALTAQARRARRRSGAWGVHGAHIVHGVLKIPTITAPFAGGTLTAHGRITLWDSEAVDEAAPLPTFDLSIRVQQASVATAFGEGFVTGTVSLKARVRGSLNDLAITVDIPPDQRIRVLGEPFRLPTGATLHLGREGLSIPVVRMHGLRPPIGDADFTALSTAGTIGFDSELDLSTTLDDFPFGRLPALAEAALPFSGRLSGQLRVRGLPGHHAIAGRLIVEGALFQGRKIGGGALEIRPRPAGAIRVTGQLIEGVSIDGVLAPAGRGLRGEASLLLRRVRLDPFLGRLPGDLSAAGILSGLAIVRLEAGQPSIEARLDELSLSVVIPWLAPAQARGAPPKILSLHAADPVVVSARPDELRLQPARIVGAAGTLLIAGEQRGGVTQGSVQGRIELGALAPLMARWLDRLSGAITLDLAARATEEKGKPPAVTGNLVVAAPISFETPLLPFDVRVPSGRLEVTGTAIVTTKLPIVLAGSACAVSGGLKVPDRGARSLGLNLDGVAQVALLRRLMPPDAGVKVEDGTVSISGRLDGSFARPHFRGQARPRNVILSAPALKGDSLRIDGGTVAVDQERVTVRAVEVRLGKKVQATVGSEGNPGVLRVAWAHPTRVVYGDLPGTGRATDLTFAQTTIEAATFGLRLNGDPRRRLRLAGTVDLQSARVRSSVAEGTTGGDGPAAASQLPATDLDIHVAAPSGAVTVDLPHAPNVHVGLDFQVRGTMAHPLPTGKVRPGGAYSTIALILYRLLH